MRLGIVLAALLALVAASAAPASDEVPVRPCGSRGDPSDGSAIRFARAGDLVIGPVSFAGIGRGVTASDRGVDGRFFSKSPAKVLWGGDVTVTASDAILDYAQPVARTESVRFEPCPPGTAMFRNVGRLRRVTMFPGGFSYARPGCYALEVKVERGRTYRGRVRLGVTRCP